MSDYANDLKNVEITTVLLPDIAAKQRRFLKRLQAELSPEGTMSALVAGPSPNVFVIPHAVEQSICRKLGLTSADAWNAQLAKWGATHTNRLLLDAYVALMTRGSMVVDGELIGPPKVVAVKPPRQKVAEPGFVPKSFAGPYDWHIDERGVNAVAAWRMFAADLKFAGALPWSGIRVAHIDTGYTEHAALGWEQGQSSTVHPDDGKDFWDGAADTDGPRDPFLPGFPGHGTRISAAISGYYPTAQGGPFYGVAPGAQIIPLRVTDSVLIDHVQDSVRDAIHAAIANNCHVVNISLGALRPSKSLAAALDAAYDAGLIVACAAGQVWGEVIYPGRFNRCVTMGGVGPGLKPWRSAAKGIYVDLCGPADGIRRIRAESLPPKKAGTEMADKTGDGTSYATACCSGAAALWLAWHGIDALRNKYAPTGLWQIPKAFKYLAMKHITPGKWAADDVGNYGTGVLNIEAILKAPLPDAGTMRPENLAYGAFDNGSL